MVTLDQDKLTLLAGVLKPYLDAQKEREVGAVPPDGLTFTSVTAMRLFLHALEK